MIRDDLILPATFFQFRGHSVSKKSVIGILVGTLALSCATLSWAGGIYRWVDAQGVTHFGEKPPAPGVGEKIRVSAPGPSIGAPKAAESATPQPQPATNAPAAASSAAEAAQAKAQADLIKKNCESYATNLKVLQEHGQIREATIDGQVKMLSDDEKKSRMQEAEKYLAEKCQKAKP